MLLKQLGPYAPIQPSISSGSTIQLTHPYPDYSIKRSTQQRAVVQHIQRRLNTLGHQPALTTDGYFGPKTQQAVKWFQMSYTGGRLLKIDGIIGAKTWAALFK